MNTGNNRSQKRGFLKRIRSQRGAIMVMVATLVVGGGILCFCILAIDGPIMMTTKTQLQNAADGGALAAALAWDTSDDDTKEATRADAVAAAQAITSANLAVQDIMRPVVIQPSDVVFDDDEGRVYVHTYRTEDHGDPLRTYFLKLPDQSHVNLVDVQAVAAAEKYAVCGVQCLKPWAMPDRWHDTGGDPQFNAADGDWYDPLLTGYLAPGDVGLPITLHSDSTPGPAEPGHYYSIDLPPINYPGGPDPITGGDAYREWIATCAPYYVSPGDSVQLEPGLMAGPTTQGVRDLINQDPGAYWDPVTKTIQGSTSGGISPRIALVPFYDPSDPASQGRQQVTITKIGAFFIESVKGSGEITGRFIKVGAQGLPCDDPNQEGAFVTSVHLVE